MESQVSKRFDEAIEQAYVAVQDDDLRRAADAYLRAHRIFSQSEQITSLDWREQAHNRLKKVYDVLREE